MKVLTEADLRSGKVQAKNGTVLVEEGTFVTPSAREYLKDRGINLGVCGASKTPSMPCRPIVRKGNKTYINAETGESCGTKPERMTHLRGNLLVPKSHPRILLRGKLDSLQAQILLIQARCAGKKRLCGDLGELLLYVRKVLAAEVNETPLENLRLFGLEQDRMRQMSHRVRENFGIDHPVPDAAMGETTLGVNLLRTQAREAELYAVVAFGDGEDYGIISHLNRLSSGIYILFCRINAGYYREEGN